MHPLGQDLSGLSLEELHKKYGELLKRVTMAYQWGKPDIVNQLNMLIQDYKEEIDLRNRKQMEEMQKNSKNFKNIIDIK